MMTISTVQIQMLGWLWLFYNFSVQFEKLSWRNSRSSKWIQVPYSFQNATCMPPPVPLKVSWQQGKMQLLCCSALGLFSSTAGPPLPALVAESCSNNYSRGNRRTEWAIKRQHPNFKGTKTGLSRLQSGQLVYKMQINVQAYDDHILTNLLWFGGNCKCFSLSTLINGCRHL